jgi:hypothetical protein
LEIVESEADDLFTDRMLELPGGGGGDLRGGAVAVGEGPNETGDLVEAEGLVAQLVIEKRFIAYVLNGDVLAGGARDRCEVHCFSFGRGLESTM